MKEDYKKGYCMTCKTDQMFANTFSPTGFYICPFCHHRTDEELKPSGFTERLQLGYVF